MSPLPSKTDPSKKWEARLGERKALSALKSREDGDEATRSIQTRMTAPKVKREVNEKMEKCGELGEKTHIKRVGQLKRRGNGNKALKEKRHPAFGEHLLPDYLFGIIDTGKAIYDAATDWGSRALSKVAAWVHRDPQPYADTGFYMDNESVASQDSWFGDSWSTSETRTPSVFGEFEDDNVDSSAKGEPVWWGRKATTNDPENPMPLNSLKSSFFVMTEPQELPTDMYGTQETRLDLVNPNPLRDSMKTDYTWESLLLDKEYQLYKPVVRIFNDPKCIMSSPHGYKKRWAADFGTPSSTNDPVRDTWLQMSMVAVGGVAVVFLGLRIWKRRASKLCKK